MELAENGQQTSEQVIAYFRSKGQLLPAVWFLDAMSAKQLFEEIPSTEEFRKLRQMIHNRIPLPFLPRERGADP